MRVFLDCYSAIPGISVVDKRVVIRASINEARKVLLLISTTHWNVVFRIIVNNVLTSIVVSQIYTKFVTELDKEMDTDSNDIANHSIARKILGKIKNHNRSKLFSPDDFSGIGSVDAIRQALHRLTKDGFLVRLAQGIYLYPKIDKELGVLYPPIEDIAKVIAKRDRARIVPTGVYALNRLGLSTQVPMRIVYLTDGAPRNIQIGKQSIKFKKTVPRNLSTKGEISGLVIQALREIGKDNSSQEQLTRINELLRKEDIRILIHDAKLAPVWISEIMLSALKKN